MAMKGDGRGALRRMVTRENGDELDHEEDPVCCDRGLVFVSLCSAKLRSPSFPFSWGGKSEEDVVASFGERKPFSGKRTRRKSPEREIEYDVRTAPVICRGGASSSFGPRLDSY